MMVGNMNSCIQSDFKMFSIDDIFIDDDFLLVINNFRLYIYTNTVV